MPLEPGTQLGAYEVLDLIGQGGMGEVYRARDGRLKRIVALKILPSLISGDPSRVARFFREAELLAALNHPNIAAIYDFVDEPGASALALEFVEGGTLADRIARGPLAVEEAVSLARQIASALAAAHARGIVHRDLKPGNIAVRPDGTAKVLDFGLAKMANPVVDVAATETPTVTVGLVTAAGAVFGTPAYMSPEQATAGAVDARADIWAFGCVLFEMLSGRRAFEGTSVTDTVTAVLTRTPDWALLPAAVSPALRVLLRRCLASDPARRPASMDAVAFVLEEERELSSASPVAPARARRLWMLGVPLFVAGLAVAVGVGVAWSRSVDAAAPTVRTTIPASAWTGWVDRNFAFTTDSRLVYVSEDGGQLLARALDSLEPTPILTTLAYLRGVYPSPDGRWLAFVENSVTLRKIPAAGGTAVTLLTADGALRGALWQPDATIVFATATPDTGLQQVPVAGGTATVLTRPDRARGELDHVWPERLPHGRGVLFTVLPLDGATPQVAVLDPETRTWRTLVEGGARARYVGSGHLVYAAAGSLWAVRFDLSRLETGGPALEVVPSATLGSPEQFDVSPNGTLVYARGIRSMDVRELTWVGRDGSETPLPLPPGNYLHPRISPDGRRLAVADADGDIYLSGLTQAGTQLARFTFSDTEDWFPVWSHDGRRIVFGARAGGGGSNLYVQDLDQGVAERLATSPDMQLPTAITPDGATVLLHNFPKDIQALSLSGARDVVTLVDSPVEERNSALSRDGRWMAYEGETAARPGELNVYVRPFPDVGRRVWQITTGGGTFPVWSHDGRELYYVKPDGTMAAAAIEVADGALTIAGVTDLFRGRYLMRDGTLGRQYDVAPDGRFLMLKYSRGTEQGHFVLVQGWTTELARLIP